ncbi:MAG: hypothetical protein LBV14_15255, partial [Acidovorax sp.]|nr:hypothetical protein [Acidovorax sp.]
MHTQLDAQQKAADALQADNKALLERLKTQEQALLETQRKSVDWWLALLGVLGGAMALLFAALPLLWTYNERKAIKEKLTEADRLLDRIQGHADKAQEIATDMSQLKRFESGQPGPAQEKAAIAEQARQAQQSTSLSDRDRLRAQAVEASQVEQATEEQAQRAYELWHALTIFDATDRNAQFNAGYWAQELFEKTHAPQRQHWLEVLGRHYKLLPTSHSAAYNWGNGLSAEARVVAPTDLAEARKLWAQAGQKYAQALSIKADDHEAANNWGNALSAEANELAPTDLAEARKLWAQAGQKYAQALSIKAD